MKYLALVYKNLLRNKRRTFLTAFSIAVSLFIFAALTSLPTAADQVISAIANSQRLVVHNKAGLTYQLPYSYVAKVRSTSHVDAAIGQCWYGGIYHDVTDQFPNWAIDMDGADQVFFDWGIAPQAWADFFKNRRASIVGRETMKRFNLHVGQQIQLRTAFPFYPNVELQIVGIADGKGAANTMLFFRRDYLEEAAKAFSHQEPFMDTIWVLPDSAQSAPQVQQAIDEQFANSSAETQTETEQAFVASFLENYRTIIDTAELLGIVVVITIGLVAANTAAMSIRERRSEIAVLRSLGFPSFTILSMLLLESILMGVTGGVLACAAALGLLKTFSLGGIGPLNAIRIPPTVLVETLIVAVAIGLLSAYFPARSAMRRSIVDTLRTVA